MDYKYVIYEKEGNIARITLNKPEKLNAYQFIGRGEDAQDFYRALEEAEEDDDIKVVIIKGAGRAFSTGHDLSKVGFIYGMGTGQPGERRPSQRTRLKMDRRGLCDDFQKLFLCPKITIAQVHGYCLAGGLIIAILCDVVIASEDALFGHTEQRLGFAGSGFPTMPLLIMSVGLKRARELILSGRMISAQEAERIGLINRVVPADKLEEETNKVAQAMCLLPRDGIAIGKAATHMAYDSLGLMSGFVQGYVTHTMFTNLRWEADEYNFFKERRDKGVRAGIHQRDERYTGLV